MNEDRRLIQPVTDARDPRQVEEFSRRVAGLTSPEVTATIDAATKSIHYVGRTTTWRGTSTTCCDQSFDVVLKKTTGAPSCQ